MPFVFVKACSQVAHSLARPADDSAARNPKPLPGLLPPFLQLALAANAVSPYREHQVRYAFIAFLRVPMRKSVWPVLVCRRRVKLYAAAYR